MVEATTPRLRGRAWMEIRQHVMAMTLGRCAECLRNDKLSMACHVDHKLALMNGGTHDFDNLEALCLTCHEAKTRKDRGLKVKVTYGTDGWPE